MPTAQPSNYLILGDEDFLKEEALKEITSKFLEPATKDLNYSVFHAKDKDFDIKEMLDVLNTAPFIARRRIVILKDADMLHQAGKDSVILYLKNPSAGSVFIIESGATRIKDEFLLEASRLAHLITKRRLTDAEIDVWLAKRSRAENKRIQKDAIGVIKENLPHDLSIISSYVDSLMLYTGKRPAITRNDAEKIIGVISLDTGFDILNAIEKKDTKKALRIYAQMNKRKKKETEFLGLLGWQLRILLRVKELAKIKNKFEIGKELGLYSSRLEQVFGLASRFTRNQIRVLLKEALRADTDIKTGSPDPQLVVERLILKMCA